MARLTKENREKTHINKIRNEREITTDVTDTQRIILAYYERLYATKFNNLKEMDGFLEMYNFPRLNDELENLNKPINSEEIKESIKNLPPK